MHEKAEIELVHCDPDTFVLKFMGGSPPPQKSKIQPEQQENACFEVS